MTLCGLYIILYLCFRFCIDSSRTHELIEPEDPEVSDLFCKRIKLEQPDIDPVTMLPEEACTLVAEFHDDNGDPLVPDDTIAGKRDLIYVRLRRWNEVAIHSIKLCVINIYDFK